MELAMKVIMEVTTHTTTPRRLCLEQNCEEPYTCHSICKMAPKLRAKVGDRMVERLSALRQTKQSQRILGEYAGVEVKWSSKSNVGDR